MSTAAPSSRLGWRILPAVLAAAAAVIAASLLIAALRGHPVAIMALGGAQAPPAPAVEAITSWVTTAAPVGMHRRLDKGQRARFEAQRERVRATVQGLVDASIFEPSGLAAAARTSMTARAATAFRNAPPLVPAKATAVEAIRRSGRIGIQAPAFKTAAATMKVTMRGLVAGRSVKWRNEITLWLERENKTWRVLAFDVERAPR